MVRAKVVTVMRLCMQDEVNQEESEQYEVDGWYYSRALHGPKISSPARPGPILFLGLLLTQTKTQLYSAC